ncbi:MAG: DUF192 domain-containing protein [Betaproteobacteria bacterium]|nr:DUF192 domain-containing protein [Betaproteobacteria bacterium]
MLTAPGSRSTAWRVLLAALLACAAFARAEAPLPVTHIKVAGHALRVEVVSTPGQMAKGLMFREKLGRNDGMLFTYADPGYHAMWMKNTLIALSVAFVDDEGRILNIEDMEPQTLDSHAAAGPARYSIETNKGWFAEHRIKAGDKVTGLPKPSK